MIVQSILLPVPPARAFQLFTDEITLWWPPDRRHSGDPLSTLHLSPSGRFYERAGDGREIELGRVVAWVQGERIEFDFYIATGPQHPTRAIVTFRVEGSGTRVTVEHGPKPESEDLWESRAPRYARSWEIVLSALGGFVLARNGT